MRLESVKIGGTACTSLEALRRFFAALGDKPESPVPAPTRDRRAEKAAAELESIGI